MQKRVFYIANAYDGRYFVLTDNLEEYYQRLSAYVLNLERSAKTNHYSFGSVEMSEAEYLDARTESLGFEQERIKTQQKQDNSSLDGDAKEESLVAQKQQNESSSNSNDENPDNVIPLFQ
jgi:hypothetical protein